MVSLVMNALTALFILHVAFLLKAVEGQDDWMVKMLELVNEERAKVDANNLCINSKLISAAKKHGRDMVKNNLNGHIGSDGSTWEERITREKYKWGLSGENVAKGQETVENVMTSFMGSPVHKANILYDRFKHFGAAWITPENQWVQVFAAAKVGVEVCDPTKPTNPPVTIPTRKPTGFTIPPSPPWKLEMLDAMNKERSKEKASALCFNYKLTNAAEKHNQDMVENNFFSHTGSDGSSIQDRIERENYKWGTTGENILKGKESVAVAMKHFMQYPLYSEYILWPAYKHVGLAWDTKKNQWTQVFAAAKDGAEVCDPSNPATSPPTKNQPTKKPKGAKKPKNKNKTKDKRKKRTDKRKKRNKRNKKKKKKKTTPS